MGESLMKKTVILCLLLPMTLFYPLIPIIAGSVTSSENIILSQGSVIYVNPSPNPSPSSFPNLAVIPNGWNLNSYYPSYCAEPYIFVDDSVTHYGNPSIRLDQGGPEDPYYPGVIDRAAWLIRRYPAQPGDHIVFKIWIKTDLNSEKENNIYSGGRAGLDGYLGNKPLSSSNWYSGPVS